MSRKPIRRFFSLSILRMSRVCVLTWLWYESYDQIYANDSIIMYQVTLKFLFAIFAVLLRSLSRWLVWIKFQQTYRNIAFHRNCIPLSKHSRCALYIHGVPYTVQHTFNPSIKFIIGTLTLNHPHAHTHPYILFIHPSTQLQMMNVKYFITFFCERFYHIHSNHFGIHLVNFPHVAGFVNRLVLAKVCEWKRNNLFFDCVLCETRSSIHKHIYY